MWQWIGRGLVVLAGLALGASFAGDLHPVGDSLAVFRPLLAIGVVLLAVLVWRWRVGQVLGGAAVIALVVHFAALVPTGSETEPDIVLYQKNMLYREADRAPLMADIIESGADLVTLQEISRVNLPMLWALETTFPHQLLCNGHSVGAVAILSRTPLEGTTCGDQPGFARAVTQIGGLPVQVYALHLFWPWPHHQPEHVTALMGQMAPLNGGVTVVGGDFNMVATGRSVARIARATGTQRVGHRVETFRLMGAYPLGIDHVLASGGGGHIETRGWLGADHLGVLAWINFD